jgi:hypothetical protein
MACKFLIINGRDTTVIMGRDTKATPAKSAQEPAAAAMPEPEAAQNVVPFGAALQPFRVSVTYNVAAATSEEARALVAKMLPTTARVTGVSHARKLAPLAGGE